MKVVCINDTWIYISETCGNSYKPKIGDELTVINTECSMGVLYYVFAETNPKDGYMATHFAPIDSVTEDAEVLEVETVNV